MKPDAHLIKVAASAIAEGLAALDGTGTRHAIKAAERKRRNKAKAAAKASKKRNRS